MKCANSIQSTLILVFTATAGQAIGGQDASEIVVPDPPSAAWEFRIEPYGWLVGLDGSTGIGPLTADVDSSFGDILENLDMAAALQVEARNGRWGVIIDGFYADLGVDGSTPGPVYSHVDLDLKQFIGELSVAYRLYECPSGFVDLYAGIRYNNLSSDFNGTLDGAGIQAVGDSVSGSVFDGIREGARGVVEPRANEFKEASTARRNQIAAEIQAKVKAEAEQLLREALVKRLRRIRHDGDLDLADVAISRISRAIKAQRLELARSNAELAEARIRASADAADAALQGRVTRAESRVAQAEKDLSKAIGTQIKERVPTRSSVSEEWLDPLIGVRAQRNFFDKWYLAGKADVGGFGAGSDLTWSVQGTVGYDFTQHVSVELGYRYLYTDFRDGNFTYDLAEHGMFLGLNVTF